jgi:hypothetical protein
MENIFKTLNFNGKNISILNAEGTWFVAVKPICDALGVNYDRQYQNLKKDDILGGVYAKQHIHDSSGRLQEMVCLPEMFVYGWLFSIRSESEELQKYRRKCYEILYNHFHGQLTYRYNTLCEKQNAEAEIAALEEELKNDTRTQRIAELKSKRKTCTKVLNELDTDLLTGQTLLALN